MFLLYEKRLTAFDVSENNINMKLKEMESYTSEMTECLFFFIDMSWKMEKKNPENI